MERKPARPKVWMLLLAVMIAALPIARWVNRAREDRRIVERIRASGGWAYHDHAVSPTGLLFDTEPRVPSAIRRVLGDDLFQTVVEVNLVSHVDEDGRFYRGQVPNDALMPSIARLEDLRKLTLHRGQARDVSLGQIRSLKHLEELALEQTKLSDAGVAHLRGLKSLKRLRIQSDAYSDPSITDRSLEVIGSLPALEELTIVGRRFSDDGLKHLAKLPRLRKLSLGCYDARISDRGLATLSRIRTLETLALPLARVSDQGLAHLRALPRLRELGCEGTSLTDAGMPLLARIDSLETVRLNGTFVSDSGLDALLRLPNLRSVDCGFTNVTREKVSAILKDRPTLWINY
jgi:hypothetical protein